MTLYVESQQVLVVFMVIYGAGKITIEEMQCLSQKVKLWGYQLFYDDSSICPWCIADALGNILWRNYGLHKAVWRLEQQVKNS